MGGGEGFHFLPQFSRLENMATTGATPASLLALLDTLIQAEPGNGKPAELRTQLIANPDVIGTWKNRSEAQWKEFYGIFSRN